MLPREKQTLPKLGNLRAMYLRGGPQCFENIFVDLNSPFVTITRPPRLFSNDRNLVSSSRTPAEFKREFFVTKIQVLVMDLTPSRTMTSPILFMMIFLQCKLYPC